MTIQIVSRLITASAADRILTYKLLPFGEPGRTNVGTITVTAGAVELPADAGELVMNIQHDGDVPAATGVMVEERLTDPNGPGIYASFRALNTRAGDDLLVEADAGVRTGGSAELGGAIIRAGRLIRAKLEAAAAVVRPAFPTANLVTAADAGELDPNERNTMDPEERLRLAREELAAAEAAAAEAGDPPADDAGDPPAGDPPADDAGAPAAAAPVAVTAARAPAGGSSSRGRRRTQPRGADEFFDRVAAAYAGGEPSVSVLAALDEGIEADLISTSSPAWLGEIWSSRTHRQRFIPLFTPAPLNSLRGVGWQFDETTSAGDAAGTLAVPTVDTYAGYPAQPNSTEVKTKAVDWKADRVAGANEFDREFIDFDTPDFWRGFYRESANDASRKLDTAALTHMLTAANHTTMNDAFTSTTVNEKTALNLIVAGVVQIQERATPDFALIGTNLWRPMLMTERQAALEYLSIALGLDPADGRLENFQLVPSAHATLAGKVLVGASESQTFYGPKTVRARTVTIANGGVQEGLFAYHKEWTADKYSKVLVTPTGAA